MSETSEPDPIPSVGASYVPLPQLVIDGGRQFRDSGKESIPEKPLWGREKTIVIGQDKISYLALSGDRNPAVLYLPAFDAPALDYKAERLRS